MYTQSYLCMQYSDTVEWVRMVLFFISIQMKTKLLTLSYNWARTIPPIYKWRFNPYTIDRCYYGIARIHNIGADSQTLVNGPHGSAWLCLTLDPFVAAWQELRKSPSLPRSAIKLTSYVFVYVSYSRSQPSCLIALYRVYMPVSQHWLAVKLLSQTHRQANAS